MSNYTRGFIAGALVIALGLAFIALAFHQLDKAIQVDQAQRLQEVQEVNALRDSAGLTGEEVAPQ